MSCSPVLIIWYCAGKRAPLNRFFKVLIKGEFIGGCTDLFDGIKDGKLLAKLTQLDIEHKRDVSTDPYHFLPGWLHPR